MKSPIILLEALKRDVLAYLPDVKGLDRDLLTIEKRFKHEGLGFLSKTLPILGDAIFQGITSGRFLCPTNFKRVRKTALPTVLSGLLQEVFEPSSGLVKENHSTVALGFLRQVTYLFKKMATTDADSDKLHAKACGTFWEAENDVISTRMDDTTKHLLHSVSKLILADLKKFEPAEGSYKHGPGAVFEGKKGNQKWSFLFECLSSEGFYSDRLGYTEFLYSSASFVDYQTELRTPRFVREPLGYSYPSSSSAKLITVPKTAVSRRTITVEPLLRQFVQQGLNTALRDSILKCSVLSRCIALADQTKNQILALEGSRTGAWATIDLKAASDLLSLELVKLVFSDKADFLGLLLDSRSPSIMIDREVRHIAKYAGMGNATTFPVQTICFAVTCMAGILDADGHRPTMARLRRAASKVRLYGDDIIVASDYAPSVVNWLEKVGLKINRSKSFMEGNFRESCGVDAYKGVDITPLYVRHYPVKSTSEPKLIESFVSLSNQSWFKGLWNFSTCVSAYVEGLLKEKLPLVRKNSGTLGWHTYQDCFTIERWNKQLQRFETRAFVSSPLKRKDPLDGWPALLKWFHRPSIAGGWVDTLFPPSTDKEHLSKSDVRYKNRIRRRWLACYSQ